MTPKSIYEPHLKVGYKNMLTGWTPSKQSAKINPLRVVSLKIKRFSDY